MISITQHLSIASLQHLAAVLRHADDAGVTIHDLNVAVDKQLAARMAVIIPQTERPKSTNRPCPSCGRGLLVEWPRISKQAGARVIGCLRCHYSEIS